MSAADNPFLSEPDNRTPVTVMLDPATAARLETAMTQYRTEFHDVINDDNALCDWIFLTGLHFFEGSLMAKHKTATTTEGTTHAEHP